ncbi:MAG: tRNA (adenosine(37)-N6)-dimethylallyltransferase MiaA [Bacteroidota bacterium]
MQDTNTSLYDLIVITGCTATGKTSLAAEMANRCNGQIISADSRQVYKDMDIGTGKDRMDYNISGKNIPVHLIDIAEPGYEYNVFEYQQDFFRAFQQIRREKAQPIMCGGTGLYIEAALAKYRLLRVPENDSLRKQLHELTITELEEKLKSLRSVHNTTDITDRNRLIRAIEIETYQKDHPGKRQLFPEFSYIIFATDYPRPVVRERITNRLKYRLENGMINEIQQLLKKGLKPDQLEFYGLEYKYITRYLTGDLTYDEMFTKLNTSIHQFAKRQMTWFRRMERKGYKIHWISGELPQEEKIRLMINQIQQKHEE